MAERTRTAGWMPHQHGAWAMLVVPFAVGTFLCWRASVSLLHVAPMFATWMLGYLAFHAASGLLKSPARRRGRWLPALAVYGGATLLAGLVTVYLAGPGVLLWLAILAVPLAVALVLAARRRERSLAGGLLTTFVASTMVLVPRFPDPVLMLHDPDFPAVARLSLLMFGYFGGTVLHVKVMIRERGRLIWRNAAVSWHTLWTVACAVGAVTGRIGQGWPLFFLIATVRAWLLPLIDERRRIRPLVVGMIELGLSLTLVLLALVDTPA